MREILDQYERLMEVSVGERTEKIIVASILLGFLLIRLLTIANPDINYTLWKELDYIAISQGYVENGFTFQKPTIWWPAELPRVTAMEFPLVPYLAGLLIQFFGFNPYTIRIITVISFLLIGYYSYKLVRQYYGPFPSILSLVLALMIPFNFMFGNILYSEPLLIASSVICLYFFSRWSSSGAKKYLALGLTFFSLGLLLKPTSLYMVIPIIYFIYNRLKFSIREYFRLIPYFAIAVLPAVGWYAYAIQLTKSSIDVFGIVYGHNKFQTLTMLSDKVWYFNMILRFRALFFGVTGLFLLVTGLLNLRNLKHGAVFYFYLLALGSFLVIVAEGHLDAPYRQYTFIPVCAFFIASGAILVISILYTLFHSWLKIKISFPAFVHLAFTLSLVLAISYFAIKSGNYMTSEIKGHPRELIMSDQIKKFKRNEPESRLVTLGAYSIHVGGNDLSPVIYHYSGVRGWALQREDWELEQVRSKISRGADLLAAFHIDREEGLREFVERLKMEYPVLYEDEDQQLLLLSLKAKKRSQ